MTKSKYQHNRKNKNHKKTKSLLQVWIKIQQEFPPESRDEQIRHLFEVATPYLIAAVVFITVLCCWSCLLSCISAVFVGCFNVVRSLFRCVGRCFCCCRGRRMRAPGRSPMTIRRAAFEANPRGYFRDLRGQPNNFVY